MASVWWLAPIILVVSAFDYEAHDAVGQTAASALGTHAANQAKRLLKGQTVSDVGGWGQQVSEKYPMLTGLHFQVHSDTPSWCGPADQRVANCEDNVCLLSAIKYFYGRILQDEGRKIDYPVVSDHALGGLVFADADAVKMLINLIGDLHQPFHVGFASDGSGKSIQISFRGKVMSAYDFWDAGIGKIIQEHEPGFWLGGWTHVRAIQDDFERDTDLWQREGAFSSFERWVSETADFACRTAYVMADGKKLGGPGSSQGVVEIDEATFNVWRRAWLRQILLAGERTAVVLNDILEASAASMLHQGGNIVTKADEDAALQMKEIEIERRRIAQTTRHRTVVTGTPLTINPSAFGINLLVAIITVPCFLVVARLGLNPTVYAALLKNLLAGNVGGAVRSTSRREE